MIVSCKNCGGFFTPREMELLKPPKHPWELTAVGQRTVSNAASVQPCPRCGQYTLGSAAVVASR